MNVYFRYCTCTAKCQEGTIKFVLQPYITLSLLSKLNNGFSVQLTIQKVSATSHKVSVRSIINDSVMEKGQEKTLLEKRKENLHTVRIKKRKQTG